MSYPGYPPDPQPDPHQSQPQYPQYPPPGQYPPQQYPQAQYPQPYGYPAPATGSNGIGIAGFVCGLVGLLLFWIPVLGLILALLGAILGGVGMAHAKRDRSSAGLSIAGLVLGIIGLVPGLIIAVALFNF